MSTRKYTEFEIGRRVNVSCTGHYSFHIHIKGYKTRWLRWDGGGHFWTQSSYPKFPAYVMVALRTCLLERLKASDTIFYENDRNGNERTTDLRYHDPEMIQSWIERLEAELSPSWNYVTQGNPNTYRDEQDIIDHRRKIRSEAEQ